MAVSKLKSALVAFEIEEDDNAYTKYATDRIEVLADSVQQALRIASQELKIPIEHLDYTILHRGKTGFLGFGKTPYHVLIFRFEDIEDDRFLDLEDLQSLNQNENFINRNNLIPIDKDGFSRVRIYKTGVYLTVVPPEGNGVPIDIHTVLQNIKKTGVNTFDQKIVEKVVKEKTNEAIKIAQWTPLIGVDSKVTIQVSANAMEAKAIITKHIPGGRHIELNDVLKNLNNHKVIFGIDEKKIQEALDNDVYETPFIVAQGRVAQNGRNAYVDYKIRTHKDIEFHEDSHGRVDFLNQNLVENVVQGQLLAQLIPEEPGIIGQTVTGIKTPAKDGKPLFIKPGKGTVLSSDKKRLMAQKNGQVVFFGGVINVEDVYFIPGDVGITTGNISFLGSLRIAGSIEDNMKVQAAGNIEVAGTIQKAYVEAEGDIIVRSGIQGRHGATIESTNAGILAKFVQNSDLKADKDIVVSEAIMHSKVQTCGKIICNGRRAQIVGGELLASKEIRVKQLGSQGATPTLVVVGINPKMFKKQKHWEQILIESQEKLNKLGPNLKTLLHQKQTLGEKLPKERQEMLDNIQATEASLKQAIEEAKEELRQIEEETNSFLNEGGAIHVEQVLYPGVTIEINNARFITKDEYHKVTLIEDKGNIKIVPYRPLETPTKTRKGRR